MSTLAFTLNPGDHFTFPKQSGYAGQKGCVQNVQLMTNDRGQPIAMVSGYLPPHDAGKDFVWFALLDWTVELQDDDAEV